MRSTVFALGLLFAGVAYAQNPPLNYRSDDPFIFCKEGQDFRKKPERCWQPIAPYTGAWITSPWCVPIMDPYGREWDDDDIASLQEYLSICPRAMESGGWDGKDGAANMVPTEH